MTRLASVATRMRQRGPTGFVYDAVEWRIRAVRRYIADVPRRYWLTVRRLRAARNRAASAGAGRRSAARRLILSVAYGVVLSMALGVTSMELLVTLARRTRRILGVYVVRPVKVVMSKLMLTAHRGNAKVFWPGIRGIDLWLVAGWMALLRFHHPLLSLVCNLAPRLRRRLDSTPVGQADILHVTCSFDLGGTQTQIRNLCTFNPALLRYSHSAIEIFPEVNYLYRQGTVVEPSTYTGSGVWGRFVGRLISWPGTRSAQLVQILKLYQDFRTAQPKVVIGWGHEMCMLTFVAATLARVPNIIFCIRTFNPSYGWVEPKMGRLLKQAHAKMLPYVTGVIVNSTALQQDYATWLGVEPALISVSPNGIDAMTVEPQAAQLLRRQIRERHGLSEDMLILLHVGRFSAEKGQMSLMEANRRLLQKFPDVPFVWVLCGDGPTMGDVQQFAAAHDMSNVIFAGRTTEVGGYLCAADVFVMPSDFEGMPNAMMEAMAQGLAAVSTDVSGALDVARDGHEALYYRPRDIDTLVAHLTRLITQPRERLRLGSGAQARMSEFSVERSVATFESRLDESLAKHT